MKRLSQLLIGLTVLQLALALWFRRSRNRIAGARNHFRVIWGGSSLRPSGEEIADSVVSVLKGGLVLDLRGTGLTDPPARLDVSVIMGGLMLVVPDDWNVRVDVQPLMAGVQDERRSTIDPARPVDLVVSGHVVMGGLDIASELPQERGKTQPGPAGI